MERRGHLRGGEDLRALETLQKENGQSRARENKGRAFSDISVAPLSPATITQLPHVQRAGITSHSTSICCLVTLLRARVLPPSALLHMTDFPPNDGHSNNDNNYRGNNKIRMDWEPFSEDSTMCRCGGKGS